MKYSYPGQMEYYMFFWPEASLFLTAKSSIASNHVPGQLWLTSWRMWLWIMVMVGSADSACYNSSPKFWDFSSKAVKKSIFPVVGTGWECNKTIGHLCCQVYIASLQSREQQLGSEAQPWWPLIPSFQVFLRLDCFHTFLVSWPYNHSTNSIFQQLHFFPSAKKK